MNKITVFWIEDNPIIDNCEEINGVKIPKLIHKDFFNYCLFQHPKEVEEYLTMICKLTDDENTSHLADNCPIALPDIVVFDYKLSDNLNTRNSNALLYSNADHLNFIKNTSANLKIKEYFPKSFNSKVLFIERDDVLNGNYSGDEFAKELHASSLQDDDEFGLYCGIAILREFKDYVTCGIPATINKADKSTMKYNSLFYEWLNSYDLKGAIERPDKSSKSWTEILNFSIKIYRKRIENQINSSKIIINLSQLMNYVEALPIDQEQRIFSFESVYGERHLPLDGLFIDMVDIEQRDHAIMEWIKGKDNFDDNKHNLLGILSTTTSIHVPEINNAKLKYKGIYDTYKGKFLERILLSDFSRRDKESLLGNYKELFDNLKLKYCIAENGEIHEDQLCSIERLFNNKELKESQKKQQELRLTVLMLATRLWIDHQIGNADNSEISLTKEDYYYVLNPIVNAPGSVSNPLTLLMHCDIPGSTFMDSFQKFLKRSCANIPESDWSHFKGWIKPGEQKVLKAFFQSELFNLKKLPDWLS